MEEYSIDSYIDPQNVLASTGESSLLAITLQTIKERKKMRKITKIRKSVKAISPIIATLLLIAIAVVAALVVYAWVMGYIGFQQFEIRARHYRYKATPQELITSM